MLVKNKIIKNNSYSLVEFKSNIVCKLGLSMHWIVTVRPMLHKAWQATDCQRGGAKRKLSCLSDSFCSDFKFASNDVQTSFLL